MRFTQPHESDACCRCFGVAVVFFRVFLVVGIVVQVVVAVQKS